MHDSPLQQVSLFIRQNQTSFPRKRPLDLEIGHPWYYPGDSQEQPEIIDALALSLASASSASELDLSSPEAFQWRLKAQLQIISRQQQEEFSCMRSRLAFYEAVGRPRAITASTLPLFYEHAMKNRELALEQGQHAEQEQYYLEFDRLVQFSDDHMNRMDYGEALFMQKFFMQCTRLETLDLVVGHPDLFAWAAEAARQEQEGQSTLSPCSPSSSSLSSSPPTRVLPALRTLNMWSSQFHRFSIQALHDAMTAFAPSLRNVKLSVHPDREMRSGAAREP
ncbi:hypothetical protein EDD11_000678, partial [Mortierella claussenii]